MCINYVYFFRQKVHYVSPKKFHLFNNNSFFSKDFNQTVTKPYFICAKRNGTLK